MSNALKSYFEQLAVLPVNDRPAVVTSTRTLWVPNSTRRAACTDLNHELYWEGEHLMGVNANCGTEYIIIEVPSSWPSGSHDFPELRELQRRVAEKRFIEPSSYVITTFNLDLIEEALKEMANA